MFGKLTLSSVPWDVPIIMGTGAAIIVVAVAVLAAITYYGQWGYLWRDWITSVDHKKLGIMYFILGLVMLFRGFADALMMRGQLALASGGNLGYLPPHHYDQIFTAHGTIMIFFMAMAIMQGLFNIVVPLQIGARDVAFPFLNNLSFWMTTVAAMLVNVSLLIGEFSMVGWLAYPPLSELQYSPGVGVDYYIWAVQISGVGTLLTAVNFFTTIAKMRAPGMSLMKMPVFCWTVLASCILILLTFPILTVTITALALDRYLGFHFFTNDFGGNQMLYVNLIWAWGHPEVYILILPAFGIFSEVVAVFCRKPLFSYVTMVYATMAICVLSGLVWVHHFFTMGAGGDVNAVFGIATMVIAIPTGVKIFNWLFTMYRGRIEFSAAMWWTIAFMVTFVIGGMTGVMLAIPPADFMVHNSLFLVAHFHNTIIGGVYFGFVAGMTYWFPKAIGVKMNETVGKLACAFWFVGFYTAFFPLYIVGMDGMTRRLNHYDNPMWHQWMLVAAVGALLILCGIACQLLQLYLAYRNRNNPVYIDNTGDPWNARTLEWSLSSPPPVYNFAHLPQVAEREAFLHDKESGIDTRQTSLPYQPIHMPKNTAVGFIISALSFIGGFALVWHIWWLAVFALLGIVTATIIRCCQKNTDYFILADEVAETENERTRNIMAQVVR